ncbi:nose resistant to fluoxetine protein 6, partial [Orussus abietinus]|uniref:nose resistant to fluoxetine protein 6 n=1 Tax=Orussus abietinus TaxID=222816 RepID=UPI000C715B46
LIFLVLDSSSKIQSGILIGNLVDLGMFDECISVDMANEKISIRGRHCMYSLISSSNSSVPVLPTSSICLPSACSAQDLARLLNDTISVSNLFKDLGISSATATCSRVDPPPWSIWEKLTLSFLCIMVSFMVFCTACDIVQRYRTRDFRNHVLRGFSKFSMYTTGLKIMNMKSDPDSLTIFAGIRILSMCWIVLGHEYVMGVLNATDNLVGLMDWLSTWNALHLLLAPFAVDTFFVISGFLGSYLFLKKHSTGARFNVFHYYIHRYVRLTPAVAVLIAITIFIVPRLGSGAKWEQIVDMLVEPCNQKWWTILLYVQNFVHPENTCLIHTWYLAVDMQLFWVSPLIFYPMVKKPKLGLAIWGLFFVASIIIPAAIISANRYISVIYESNIAISVFMDSMTHVYIPSYTRATPWLIGVLLGYIMFSKNFEYRRLYAALGWSLAVASFVICAVAYRTFQNKDYKYDIVWETTYPVASRTLWGIGIAWIIFACLQKSSGPVSKFLSLPIFIPLSRLSYCIYLVHVILQCMRVAARRTPMYFSRSLVFTSFLSSLVMSIVIGLFFSMLFESPVMILEKMLTRRVKSDKDEYRRDLVRSDDEESAARDPPPAEES